ncbi:MAG: enoyl-CoA hydratase/isomerase family protein [Granulosicoccus sp.]|nr:enoyl-CoA hydratase/isomerase family protein [Granulosicoccus sp.]
MDTHGTIGHLVLSQPATLNALTLEMVQSLHAGLDSLENDDTVRLIIIRSASSRAFCAGGDMKHIRQLCLAEDYAAVEEYFSREYALNLAISRCTKPYLALIDGVAMGGGLGISVHGRFRVVTERASMSMPETRIGFFPDVGASWFLPRLPQRCGYWMALTAAPVTARQAVQAGLATHYLASDSLTALVQTLQGDLQTDAASEISVESVVERTLRRLSPVDNEQAAARQFQDTLRQRARWFVDDDLPGIRARLHRASNEFDDAAWMLSSLDSASPYSLATTIDLFQQARGLDLRACLQLEFATARAACRHPDLIEGVRAVLVDKDRHPDWRDA